MPNSRAFELFKESLVMVEELLRIERESCHNPPRLEEQKMAQGLRGGAVVLMVASFENFLKQVFEEHLSTLTVHPPIPFDRLPEKMRITCMELTLEYAMKGPPFQPRPPISQRLVDIDKACRMLVYQGVNPSVFSDTHSNPNSKTVRSMFSNVGIERIFDIIKARFESEWQPRGVAHTYIPDKLDEIVNRRHIVAHRADVLNVTRSDLNESLKFLKVLAKMLDLELERHVTVIKK